LSRSAPDFFAPRRIFPLRAGYIYFRFGTYRCIFATVLSLKLDKKWLRKIIFYLGTINNSTFLPLVGKCELGSAQLNPKIFDP
jgi:hypothetical protein